MQCLAFGDNYAQERPSHAGAGNAAHEVFPKREFGGGSPPGLCLVVVGGGGVQGEFPVRSLVDGAGSCSVAHGAGLLPTELTGMWGWILLRSSHQGRGHRQPPTPTEQ